MSKQWWRRTARGTGVFVAVLALIADVAVSDAGPDGSAESEAASAASVSEPWPIEIIDRPLTLPAGWMSAGLAIDSNRDLSAIGSAATGLWGVSYGVTDDLSVGVGYALALKELEGRGPLDVNAGYTYLVAGPLTLTATGTYSHDFMTGLDQVAAGTMMWLMLHDRIALISPGGQIAYTPDDSALAVSLPIAAGVQASSRIFAQLGINLADVGVANAETALFGADQAALELAVFASPVATVDIGATVGADPKAGVADTATFGLVVMVNRGLGL